MELIEYKKGQNVEVELLDIKSDKMEWKDGVIDKVDMIYPNNGSKHPPYPIVIVKTTRTYCKTEPQFITIQNNIRVFITNKLTFYTKKNTEGFIYKNNIRLKEVI